MIRELRVQNFKSLRDVSVTLGLRNLLVGPNMAGKSNLISAFRFLARMILPGPDLYGLAKAIADNGGFSELVWKGANSNLISLSIRCGIPMEVDEEEVEWHYIISLLGDNRGGATVQEERLQVATPDRTFSLIDKVGGERVMKNPNGDQVSRVLDTNRSALEFEVPDWKGNILRRYVAFWRFYRLVPGLMKQANPTAATSFLNELGENLSSWLMMLQTRYPESFNKMRAVARDVFPGLEDVFTWPTQQASVFVASREKYLKGPISVWQMSDGELAFLALLSLIYCPLELGGSLYCVEEPENHLHPKLIETLVELLRQVQNEFGPKKSSQVLVSTHSPYLVDKMSLDELLVAERHEAATRITRPSDKRHLRDLLTREEVGLGDLYYSGALSSA